MQNKNNKTWFDGIKYAEQLYEIGGLNEVKKYYKTKTQYNSFFDGILSYIHFLNTQTNYDILKGNAKINCLI